MSLLHHNQDAGFPTPDDAYLLKTRCNDQAHRIRELEHANLELRAWIRKLTDERDHLKGRLEKRRWFT